MVRTRIILVIFLILSFGQLAGAQEAQEYLSEFNESNERVKLDSVWIFLTNDTLQRNVTVYSYCSGTSCTLVIFDIANKTPLDYTNSVAFFENYKLKDEINKGKLTSDLYRISFEGSESITCDLLAPKFEEEARNFVAEVGAEKVAPKVLPENAAVLVENIYGAGKKIGVVSKTNIPVLIVGASCIGSDALKSVAVSTLKSCSAYVENIKENKGYQGQPEDLNNCHSDAIKDIKIATFTPNILFGHLETRLLNVFRDKPEESVRDMLIEQIQTLEKSKGDIIFLSPEAKILTTNSLERIKSKSTEANNSINNLSSKITDYQSVVKREIFGFDYTWIFGYDYENAKDNLQLAENKLQIANDYYLRYKYNSAIGASTEGSNYAELSKSSIEIENSKSIKMKIKTVISKFLEKIGL